MRCSSQLASPDCSCGVSRLPHNDDNIAAFIWQCQPVKDRIAYNMDNTDHILSTLNRHRVDYLVIGGFNFLLRHSPVLTYDIDVWIEDSADNRQRCEKALAELQAEWGMSDEDWGPVAARRTGWLEMQSVFCMTSANGAIDVFRSVEGMENWAVCRARAAAGQTASGIAFWGLSDADMLGCQLALPEGQRNQSRIRYLEDVLRKANDEHAT
jgi:hypothetical protein